MWSVFYAIKRSWTQHFVTQFSSFIVMVLTMSAVILIATTMHNAQRIFDIWGKANRVTAYMKPNSGSENVLQFKNFLTKQKVVESFKMVDSAESAKRFKNNFSKLSTQKLSQKKIEQFFPAYFEIRLDQNKAYREGAEKLESFSSTLKAEFPFIGSVSYGKKWLNRYVHLLSQVKLFGYFLIFLFVMASLIVCANIIKTLLYSKRDEIEILEFIGADEFSIYLPQVLNVLLLVIFSFFVALLSMYGLFSSIGAGELLSTQLLNQLQFLPALQISLFLALFSLSTLFYSAFTILNLLPGRRKKQIISEVIR